jgi:hypothetical protein
MEDCLNEEIEKYKHKNLQLEKEITDLRVQVKK